MRRLVRIAVLVAGVVTSLGGAAPPAAAHPLGNFTVSTSSALTVRRDAIAVAYVVDMAEIPAFSERRAIDADADGSVDASESGRYATVTCATLAHGLDVRADDRLAALTIRGRPSLTFPAGAGGLFTLRLECTFSGTLSPPIRTGPVTIRFADRNYPEVIGWREVTAVADGVTLERSDVPTLSATAALKSYPRDELPLDVRTATLAVTGGAEAVTQPETASAPPTISTDGGNDVISELISRRDLSPMLVALVFVVTLGVGALHALGPGHGKTLLGAYLVGADGTMRQAVGVGVAVSLMHTVSVLLLGAVVLTAERVVTPERVYAWLGVAAGTIAISIGGALLTARLRGLRRPGRDHGAHAHAHPHGPGSMGRRGLAALAFSGGALPSPTALVVFLGAVSVGRAALGLMLIAAFSIGLAASLIGVGVVTLRTRDLIAVRLSTRALRSVPVLSAALIIAMGVFVTVRGASAL